MRRDALPLNSHITLQAFDKWKISFFGPIQPPGKKTGAHFIITAMKYLARWAETTLKDYNIDNAAKFIFKFILSRFGCLKILMSDRGSHFLNETILALTKEFQIYHQKGMSYHP